MSNTPLGVGENFELILILRINLVIAGWDKEEVSKLYREALAWMEDK